MAVRNMITAAGQSNIDLERAVMLGLMAGKGISNPAYSEAPVPGRPFRKWQTGSGAAEYVLGTEAPTAVVGISESSGVVTLDMGFVHDYKATTMIVVSGVDQSEYNGVQRIDSIPISPNDDKIKYSIDPGASAPTGASIQIRRAGFREVYEKEIQDILDAGDTVNLLQWQWGQGEGNTGGSKAAPSEYAHFITFLQETDLYFRNTLGAMDGVTVDSSFNISIMLTALFQSAIESPLDVGELRTLQTEGADAIDNARWVETIQLPRGDGVHISDPEEMKSRMIDTYFSQRNKPAPVPQFGFN